MRKVEVTATTGARRKALAAATEKGDAKAMADNQPWKETLDAPVDFAEMAKVWKPEVIYDLAMRQWKIDAQATLRAAHEPASPAAKKRALIDAMLKKRGISLDDLEKEVYGTKA